MEFWRAEYTSRSFEFEAFGPTEGEAYRNLIDTLHAHAAQLDLKPEWFYADDIYVYAVRFGLGNRDREPINPVG